MQVLVFLLFNLPAVAVLLSALLILLKDRFTSTIGKYLFLLLFTVGVSMVFYAEYFNPAVIRNGYWIFDFLYCLLSPFCSPIYFLFLNRLTRARRNPVLNFSAFLPSIIYAAMFITVNMIVSVDDRHAYISNVILGQSIQVESSLAFDWLVLIANTIFKIFVPIQAVLVMIYGEFRLKAFANTLNNADPLEKRSSITAFSGIHALSFLVAALCLFISIIPVYEIMTEISLVAGVMGFEIVLVMLVVSYVLRADLSAKKMMSTVMENVAAEQQPVIRKVVTESGSPAPVRIQSYPSLIARIDAVMENERLYLKPDLSLVSLAEYIGTNRTYVSKAIKDAKKCNFSDYVNRYRLDYAIYLLKNTPKEDIVVQNIAIQCGCGSIQTFYRYFKMLYNQTPSQWIERNK